MRYFLILIFLIPFVASSQLQVAKIFSSNMILQREKPIHIWGKGLPGKIISVSVGKNNKACKVKPDSTWSIYFPAQKANKQSQTITIVSGTDKMVLENILIGDVWLSIGQSNMEWPMAKEMHYKEELLTSSQPMLRFYNPTYAGKNIFNMPFTDSIIQNLTVEKFYKGHWQTCDSNSFRAMSAMAYYFGKEIADNINVPIGLINLSIGGAPLEAFIGTSVLKSNNLFSKKLNGDWLTNKALPVWVRERGQQNTASVNNVPSTENGNNHAYKPGFAYSAGIESLFPFAIKGILNYQGESNAQEIERVNEYAALSALMIDDYRKEWKQPHLPYYFVQLSSIDTVKYKGQLWPEFRNEQRRMIQIIPYSGMAVCSDIGAKDDVHPTNKKDVGERLARWALNKTYGHSIIPSGPLPKTAKYENGKVIISFQYIAEGLKTAVGGSLKGFSIDGKNEIDAKLGDSGVLIFAAIKPEYIYYGWKPFSDGNLVNSENLPASTFKIKVK